MKKRIIALMAAGTMLLCACTANPKDTENKNGEWEKEQPNASQDVLTETENVGIKQLVDGSVSVIVAETGEKAKLNSFSEDHKNIARYAEIDLDGDGRTEYLAEYAGSGDTLIIREYENELYAYMIPFRARLDLKTDGEMMWSGGASYSGTQRIKFNGVDFEAVTVLDSNFDEDVHFINGKEVTFDEAMKAWEEFDEKENADWHDAYELLD